MAGGVVMVVILVLFPFVFTITLSVVAGLLGKLLKDEGEATHPGSELIELNT